MQPSSKPIELALEHASEIQELYLSGQRLADFPKNSAQFDISDLLCADISNNRLVELPAELCACAQLEQLRVSRNFLRLIPDCIVHLQNLIFLDISHNQLTVLPSALCRLTVLEVLLVNDNRLTRLPAELGNLSRLARLDVSCNQLVALPDSLSNLVNLRVLNLRHNLLTNLPQTFEKLRLVELDLRHNRLNELRIELAVPSPSNANGPPGSLSSTLERLLLSDNPLTSPPACVTTRGVRHAFKVLAKTDAARRRADEPALVRADHEAETDTVYDEIGLGIPNRPALNVSAAVGPNLVSRGQQRASITSATGAVYQNGDAQVPASPAAVYANERRTIVRTPNRAAVLTKRVTDGAPSQNETEASGTQESSSRPQTLSLPSNAADPAGRNIPSPAHTMYAPFSSSGVLYRFYNAPAEDTATYTNSVADGDFDGDIESVDSHVPNNRRAEPPGGETNEEDEAVIGSMRRALETALKIRLPASSAAVSELLADGVVLCHFLNSVKSRTVHTISVPSPAQPRLSAAKARRNVEAFMDGARRLGLTDTHLCDALDVLQPDTNANVSLARVARTVMRIQTRSRDGLMLGSLMKSVASRATASSSSLVSNGSAPAFQVGVDSDGEPASSMYSTPPRNYAPPANANHSGWLPATSTPTSGAGQSPYAQPSANANPNANPNRNLTPSDVSGQPNTAEGELNGAMYSSVAMRTVNQPRTMTPKSLRRDSTPVVSLPNFV